jgi:hypothetical protein
MESPKKKISEDFRRFRESPFGRDFRLTLYNPFLFTYSLQKGALGFNKKKR